MLPLYDNGAAAGLFAGVLFGYILEAAGFGSPRKLTAQFRLSDWAVIKVMFTAVVVCAIGLWLAELAGVMRSNGVFVPTVYLWSIALGGLLIGAGFALGGFCPGTAAVSLASGRGDGAAFVLGMMAGTAAFAAVFEPLGGFYMAAPGPQGQTLPQMLGVPEWVVLAALAGAGVGAFKLGNHFEAKLGGPVTARDVMEAPEGGAAVSSGQQSSLHRTMEA